jgi:hypothetical protein
METKSIDYYKIVDIIDEAIMEFSELKYNQKFPIQLRDKLLDILKFLMSAQLPGFESLLFDKRITVDKEKLNLMRKQMIELNFENDKITHSIILLEKIDSANLTIEEISELENNLLEYSKPFWISIILKK